MDWVVWPFPVLHPGCKHSSARGNHDTRSMRRSSSKTHAGSRGSSVVRASPVREWTPLMEFTQHRPFTDTNREHSLRARETRAVDPSLPRPEFVPPLPFLPATTVSTAHGPAGLLRPAAGHGVCHVSRTRRSKPDPQWHIPFEAFPSRTASVATLCLLIVGLVRRRAVDLKAFFHPVVRCSRRGCPRRQPDAPLGFTSLQVRIPTSRRRSRPARAAPRAEARS